MSVVLVIGSGGDAAPATANRDVARTRALARHVDHLVVLDPDETWWTPVGSRNAVISRKLEPVDSRRDPRRSSLANVLRDAAQREPGTVVLLLDADLDQVKRMHPLAETLDLPLLWWHEEPPSPAVVTEVSQSIAGLLTTWTDLAARPGWLWSVGAGIDLQAVPVIETFPARPPLRLLARAPARESELNGLLQALAFARGLVVDAHLTIALTDSNAADGQRHQIDAHIRNLALTRSAHVAVVDGPGSFPGLLAQAHALVDIEGSDDALTFEALLAMAHGRPVLSSREQFAPLLETALLPLRFVPGDEPQLADRMKSLAAAWSDELDSAGQTLRNAVRQEHSVTHWAESVASIVGFVRTRHRIASEVVAASERYDGVGHLAANNSAANNSSPPEAAPASTSDQPDLDVPECSPSVEDAEDPKSDEDEDEDENVNVGSRSRRWRLRR